MNRIKLWMQAIIPAIICCTLMANCRSEKANPANSPAAAVSPTDDSSQFVTLTDAVPDVILEIRYYGTYNFVAQKGVDHFVRWAADLSATEMKPYFYPDLDKSVLFEQEYIYEKSGHTRGSTVDLTLFDMATEKELDMGGTFDWFGPESHPDFCGNPDTQEYTGDNSKSPTGRSITAEQFANRMILRKAMLAHGFKALDSEWWHFTLKDEPFPDTYFTFPVKQLRQQ